MSSVPSASEGASEIRRRIEEVGFAVWDDLVPREDIAAMRAFWLNAFARPVTPQPIVWGPFLGEPNRILFDQADGHCLFRSYDFLWNPPLDVTTRRVGLELSRLRNAVTETIERAGEFMEPSRYGMYVTTSYYPPDRGWLSVHNDQVEDARHWHFILPLTFRGADFGGGGFHVTDRDGNRVDVEPLLAPGSVLFFDGKLAHGVDRIVAAPGQRLGRLQMFTIPAFLELPLDNERLYEDAPLGRVARAKLRLLKRRLTASVGRRDRQ